MLMETMLSLSATVLLLLFGFCALAYLQTRTLTDEWDRRGLDTTCRRSGECPHPQPLFLRERGAAMRPFLLSHPEGKGKPAQFSPGPHPFRWRSPSNSTIAVGGDSHATWRQVQVHRQAETASRAR